MRLKKTVNGYQLETRLAGTMNSTQTCTRCGTPRLANAPAGLCPRCLLQQGFRPPVPANPESLDRTVSWGQSDSPSKGILSRLHESMGPVPRLLIRDGRGAGTRPERVCSEEMPVTAGESGRYQLHGEIARGGMGIVLKGRDVDLGRDVAVKVLHDRHRDNPEIIRRFLEEAQIGGQLQHPGIVPVYELGRLDDERLYIAMKLVHGRTLAEMMESRANPAEDQSRYLAIFEQLCQTMAYAHSCGVIHRDLKPSNIMVGSFGEVQVMDWGLAKVIDRGGVADEERSRRVQAEQEPVRTLRSGSIGDESMAGSVLGTPPYMAPEQAQGRHDTMDERADVFGLGAILCEILTGLPPYAGATSNEVLSKALHANLADARARLDACGADPELLALAQACLAVVPKERPRDAGVVVANLNTYLVGVQERLKVAELNRARAESRAAEERKRRLLVVGLAASLLALGILGGGGWIWLMRQRASRMESATRDATEALHEASLLFGQARVAREGDQTPWVQASEAVKRSEAIVAKFEIEPGLRRQLEDFSAMFAREREQAEALTKDRRMVARLASIHANMAPAFDWNGADRDYANAFRDYGIDIECLQPAEAGKLIAASPIAVELVNSLDQWAFVHRHVVTKDNPQDRQLSAIAKTADPDPWRCRVRDALKLSLSDKEKALDAFRELATLAPEEFQYRESISRLAYGLWDLGDEERSIALLRKAQLAHPDDFWINCDLARSLMSAGQPDEAVRFYSAAVAIQPDNLFVLVALGDALRGAGREEEAEGYPWSPWPDIGGKKMREHEASQ